MIESNLNSLDIDGDAFNKLIRQNVGEENCNKSFFLAYNWMDKEQLYGKVGLGQLVIQDFDDLFLPKLIFIFFR